MMSELMADLPNGHPGCLVASFCYQDRLFDKDVRELNAAAVLNWRKRFRGRLDRIAARYPPRIEVDLDDLADMLSVIADGGIILSRTIKDKGGALPADAALPRLHQGGVPRCSCDLSQIMKLIARAARVG